MSSQESSAPSQSAYPDSHRMPPHIFNLFCRFRDMRPRRNMRVFAEQEGMSHEYIRRLSSIHKWPVLIRNFDHFVQSRIVALDIDSTSQARAEQLARVRTGIITLGNQLLDEAFGLNMKDKDLVTAFRDLIVIDRLLTGQTTENVGTSHESALDELDPDKDLSSDES